MYTFDRDVSVVEQSTGLFKATVTNNWSVNGNPNGGYLMALIANAMIRCAVKAATPIITANFLSRAEPDEAEIRAERIYQSTQFDRIQASLFQRGRERIHALGTFATEISGNTERHYEKSHPDVARLEDCVAMPEMPNYTIFNQMDVRLDPSCTGWMTGSVTEKSEIKGWIKFKDDRPWDTLSTILAIDCFPPPILASQGMVAWVPSIEMSLNIRNLPETDWLKGIFRTCFMDNGILEEDGELWDAHGILVAISRQFAQFRKAAT